MDCYADHRSDDGKPSEGVQPPVAVASRHVKTGQIGQPSIVSSVAFAAFNSILFGATMCVVGKT